ncbi:hypothetical protein [Aurantiacibacter marinus]|uniref:Lipoprotein n=1 Tax=Aurantiacibacter marinus TaxID=874156 RepID=A0A0H0XMN4_9SPHN|nr:hypothetical protein [Aurantiacibacter marinus]KLI63818.1 hypothetical protein AAV99_08915 [Aurantiacibacter marinus]
MKKAAFALPALLALAACSAEPQPEAEPTPEASPTVSGVRALVASGFEELKLGPKIAGPQGSEVAGTIMFEGRLIAEITSFVACPELESNTELVTQCDPAAQAEGAVYTYAHRITPGEGAKGPILSFRTARRANGFANVIGFDRQQAEAALGEGYNIGVSVDNGALVWRIEAGDGWDAGEEITLFWQGELPPEGPEEVYEVETAEGRAAATGPFPPAEAPESPETE